MKKRIQEIYYTCSNNNNTCNNSAMYKILHSRKL